MTRKIVTNTWTWNDFGAGKIDVHGLTLKFSNNGPWTWTGNLHDNSTFYGDNPAVGSAFNGLGHGSATSGSLGAKSTGPPVDGSVNMSGTDGWLADNFFLVSAKGATCHLHVSGDIWQLLGGLLNDLFNVAGTVLKALSSGNGTGGTEQPGDDGQDDGGVEPEPDQNGGEVGTDARAADYAARVEDSFGHQARSPGRAPAGDGGSDRVEARVDPISCAALFRRDLGAPNRGPGRDAAGPEQGPRTGPRTGTPKPERVAPNGDAARKR